MNRLAIAAAVLSIPTIVAGFADRGALADSFWQNSPPLIQNGPPQIEQAPATTAIPENAKPMYQPTYAPGEVGNGTPAPLDYGTLTCPSKPRTISDPTVADTSIGFHNPYEKALVIELFQGSAWRAYTLGPREIRTIICDACAATKGLKARISTAGGVQETFIVAGEIYLITPQMETNTWVLAKF
jgi:hypothetical protein